MTCYKHSNLKGLNTCHQCGNWLCEECTLTTNNRIICKDCILKDITSDAPDVTTNITKKPNLPLTVIASAVFPGAGLMYLGLFRKGLLISALFFLSSHFSTILRISIFRVFIPIIYTASIFYTYSWYKKICDGIPLDDNIDTIIAFLRKHATILSIIFVVVLLLSRIPIVAIILLYLTGLFIYSKNK
jgi:hypothetical protein